MIEVDTRTFLSDNLNIIIIGIIILALVYQTINKFLRYIKNNKYEVIVIANYLSNKIIPITLVIGAIILIGYLIGLGFELANN